MAQAETPAAILDRSGYELEVDEAFDRPTLDERLWIPYYLPHWSSREASAAHYTVGDGALRLRIDADQEPWSPEFAGQMRVSSLQTASTLDQSAAGSARADFATTW